MRIALLLAAAAVLLGGTRAYAQTTPEDHAAHHPQAAPSEPAKASPAAHDSSADPAVHMQEIRALMEKAEHATDAKTRDKLLGEHLVAMRHEIDSLEKLRCEMPMMQGGEMKMDGQKGDKPADMKGGMGDMMGCHQKMESKVQMLTELLEQFVRREQLLRRP